MAFWPAFWGGLVISLVNTVITTIMAMMMMIPSMKTWSTDERHDKLPVRFQAGDGRGLVNSGNRRPEL